MNVFGIIPARYASSRFPGKPLVNINGKLMIQRVYEQAAKVLKYVCIATDDQRIFDAVTSFGGHVVMTAESHQSGTDRCAEAVELFERQLNIKADVIINIQGDEPFINPVQIQQLTDLFTLEETGIATLIKKITDKSLLDNPNVVKVVTRKNHDALYFSRSRIPYVRGFSADEWMNERDFYQHIGMYGYRKEVLYDICKLPKSGLEKAESLEQLRWLENGYNIKTSVTEIESVGIDTPEDLERIKTLFKD